MKFTDLLPNGLLMIVRNTQTAKGRKPKALRKAPAVKRKPRARSEARGDAR